MVIEVFLKIWLALHEVRVVHCALQFIFVIPECCQNVSEEVTSNCYMLRDGHMK
jgi:hypothetical protein